MLGELSQQQVLVKSQIPTSDHMLKIDKEVEIKKDIIEKNRGAHEWNNIIIIEDVEESYSSSSMSMYDIDSDWEYLEVLSYQIPTLIKAQLLENKEEVHSYPTTDKIPSERHLMIHEEENISSYNIKEIFEAFTFNLYKKEVGRKRVWNEKQNDGTMKEIQKMKSYLKRLMKIQW